MTENASTVGGAAASDTPFVDKIWKEAGATFPPVAAEVDGEPCLITSVTARPAGSTYVNLTVGDEKRSLIAANHSWTRQQMEINDSAFFGVLGGAPADATLRHEPAPKTIAEARTKNRAKAVGKSYFLKCKEGDSAGSWRLVSGVAFGPDYLDALSHFDWGEKQRFSFDVITEVVSAQTNRTISIDDMKEDIAHSVQATSEALEERFPLSLIGLFIAAAIGAGVLSYFLLDRLMPPANPPIKDKATQVEATAPSKDGSRPTTSGADAARANGQPTTIAPAPQAPLAKKQRRSRTKPTR
jgi:hypothetical protein